MEHKGTVIFLDESKGSKSEHNQPYLYVDRATIFPIMVKGDNPFEHKKIEQYDGNQVIISGNEHNGVFIIEEINIEDKKWEEN